MNEDILGHMLKLSDLFEDMFVGTEYVEGDVNNFIKKMQEFLKMSYNTDLSLGDEFIKKISGICPILIFVKKALETKKIINNHKDVIVIGHYLKGVADELIKIGENS